LELKGSPDAFESVTSTYKSIRDDDARHIPHASGKNSIIWKMAFSLILKCILRLILTVMCRILFKSSNAEYYSGILYLRYEIKNVLRSIQCYR
jgi:hypothetical protein